MHPYTAELFSATFHGNDRTISNLTITNSNGDYDNAAGLFGAISSTSVLRNIHIRSANITGGVNNAGLLVGYARGAMIINSSAEGAVTASDNNVGGLVGLWGVVPPSRHLMRQVGLSVGLVDVGGLVGYGFNIHALRHLMRQVGLSVGLVEVGGLVGYGFHSATITSSYAAGGNVSGDWHGSRRSGR